MLRNSADTLEEVPALLVRCRGDGEIVAIFHGKIMGKFRPLVSARLVGDGTFPNDLWIFMAIYFFLELEDGSERVDFSLPTLTTGG